MASLIKRGEFIAKTMKAKWMDEKRVLCAKSGQRLAWSELDRQLSNKRLIFIGEHHAQPEVVEMELAIVDSMLKSIGGQNGSIFLVMEHFPIDRQDLLTKYLSGSLKLNEFHESYEAETKEGHKLLAYEHLLEYVKDHYPKIRLFAGFPPRPFSRIAMSETQETVAERAIELGYLVTKEELIPGSDLHYQFFEGLIADRPFTKSSCDAVEGNFRKIFPAQTLKDSVMSSMITRCIRSSNCPEDKFIAICGSGHCEYGFGVPERVNASGVIGKEETLTVTVRNGDSYPWDQADEEFSENFEAFQDDQNLLLPGDFIFFYGTRSNEDQIKKEIASAYDKVGETANRQGDHRKARYMMGLLGYSDVQIDVAGEDVYNFQGVGNPHKHADLAQGHHVLDIGSGLGVDSFIAADAVGPQGQVIGIDISQNEVAHASVRAKMRGLDNVHFEHADMEQIPLPDGSIDRVISNGAFCLAPNKEKAFREIHRVLKSEVGRFSVACSTLLQDCLDDKVKWPVCLRVFMPLSQVKTLLSDIGFTDLHVDMSDSKMSLEIEPQFADTDGEFDPRGRKRIHFGSEEFEHLQDLDMNEICARVVISGRKGKALSSLK